MLDLTKPLNETTAIYSEGDYRDPPFECATWCTVKERGYWVSKVALGTQTGTHIDAPAHFSETGAVLEDLRLEDCIGSYCLIDIGRIPQHGFAQFLAAHYRGERILFIRALNAGVLAPEAFEALLALPPQLWVLAGELSIAGRPRLFLHKALAESGRFLVEDLERETAARVGPRGEMIVLPLRLTEVSGSPCRVVVK